MFELYQLLQTLLSLYSFILLAYCIFSFLFALNIINPNARAVYVIGTFLSRLCEPILRPIQRILPDLGGIDISPIIVFFIIDYLIRPLLFRIFFNLSIFTH